ncbi:MAG: hypothetical protein LQ347_000129 [Umbilicaria vellea]|nr:MAG: hypothetical protein LQ347_000129 [Umbilicaria vellea]
MRRAGLRTARQYSVKLGLGPLGLSLPQTIEQRRTFTACRSLCADEGSTAPPKIRWFEKTSKTSPVQPTLSPEEEELEEVEELKARIAKLEEELLEIREGQTTIGPLLDQLSEPERQQYFKALKEASLDEDDGHALDGTVVPDGDYVGQAAIGSATEFDDAVQYMSSQIDLEIPLDVPLEQDIYLQRLNESLQDAATDTQNSKSQKRLWKWYIRCKQSLPPFLHLIPTDSWVVLWASQRNMKTSNPDRAAHLKILAEDVLSTGRILSSKQRVEYIDSLSRVESVERALNEWEEERSCHEKNEKMSEDFAGLGIRLYAQHGAPQKAQNLAEDLTTLTKPGDGTIRWIFPVIEAWIHSGEDSGIRNAWTLYLRFKSQLKRHMQLYEYDNITMCFLRAGQAGIALAVFKDMMLTGKASRYESTELYKTALGIVGSLQAESINAADLNKASMTALTALPRRFQNKFFYASWLKKLLGMGEVTAAASVVELMYERGVKPDARHINGIIGAYLRNGSARDKGKAEQMGWAMIQERLDMVAERGRERVDSAPARATITSILPLKIPSHLQRTVPPATIETFSVLLLYYGRRGMFNQMQQIKDYLARAEIHPNSYFMNHLLYAELRRGCHGVAYKIYREMSRTVQPDLQTFACLWDCEKAHLDRLAIHGVDGFPGPRLVLYDMVNWFSSLGDRARDSARQEFTRDLYDQIVRCLCLSKDVEGTIVALYALKEYFHLYPDQDTARLITLQIARIVSKPPTTTRRRRAGLLSTPQNKANVLKFAQVLVLLSEQRAETLAQRGIKVEDLDAPAQAEEHLFLLAELMKKVLLRTAQGDSTPESIIEKAAWEMGVGGLDMSDPVLH